MTPAVAMREVAVGYRARPVLARVSMAVAAGEHVALVGANGSGKTTLLRCLGGLAPPIAGAVQWLGGGLPVGPARTRRVGIVLQTESPAPFQVRDLVALGLAFDPSSPPERARRVDAALAAWSLTGLAERPCTLLSGGEWQRAVLARALIAGPALLLLDEPSNHLDPAHRAGLLARLRGLRGAVAVVIATHDLELAAACDRIAVLARGRVRAFGPAADLLTGAVLGDALGVRVRTIADPAGGPPALRIVPHIVEPEPSCPS